MLRIQIKARILILILGEGVILFTGVLLASWLRFGFSWEEVLLEDTFLKALLITLVCQTTLYFNDVYNLKGRKDLSQIFFDFLQGMGIAYVILALIYYLFPQTIIGRGIGILSFILIILLLTSWRRLYNRILIDPHMMEPYIIMGTGKLAERIASEIFSDPGLGISLKGFLGPQAEQLDKTFLNIKILGVFEDICNVVKNHDIQGIVVALNERRGIMPVKEMLKCKMDGIKIMEGTAFLEKISGKISLEDLRPSWFVFSEGFHRGKLLLKIKNLFDKILSFCGIIFMWPVMILIALAIKIESKGPVFYRQKRVGRKGKEFEVLKFRSMKQNAEENGPQWAKKSDPRITRVGSIIRKLRLDELPQLFNVLKGEMSFVGPRPERPEFVQRLQEIVPYYMERHTVNPGITGWAQVKFIYGNSIEDSLEKLQYDLYYIKNMSPFLDVSIFLRTFKVVLLGRGAL